MVGNMSCCQEVVNSDGLRTWDDDDSVESVELERLWRGEPERLWGGEPERPWRGELAFVTTWGQWVTRPDGLLRIVGRTSLSELNAFARFRALEK